MYLIGHALRPTKHRNHFNFDRSNNWNIFFATIPLLKAKGRSIKKLAHFINLTKNVTQITYIQCHWIDWHELNHYNNSSSFEYLCCLWLVKKMVYPFLHNSGRAIPWSRLVVRANRRVVHSVETKVESAF